MLVEDTLDRAEQRKNTLLGLLFAFGAASSYGILICAVKYMFQWSTVTVFEILYMRSFIALALVIFILWIQKIPVFDIDKRAAVFLFIRCICGFIGFAIEFYSA